MQSRREYRTDKLKTYLGVKMSFLVENYPELDVEKFQKAFDEYMKYLELKRDDLPKSVYEYATAPWHYDHNDSRCPHDSWLESLEIEELASGETREIRPTAIQMRLLGAFHDGTILIQYSDVQEYQFSKGPKLGPPAAANTASHGDWLVDETSLSDKGLVVHEIRFSNNVKFLIICKEFTYTFEAQDRK
jgi:hypothetical protein